MKVSRSQSGGEQYLALQSIARATGQGFEQLAVRRGYYPAHGGREDALIFSLLL